MGLVKTRRLAAMHKQQRAKAGKNLCLTIDLRGRDKNGMSQEWNAKWEKGGQQIR